MRVTKIKVNNFRLLNKTSVDLEDELSVIIGKNNCGKTSLLLVLDKFLGKGASKNSFTFDDFNIAFKDKLKARVESIEPLPDDFQPIGISLKLFIEYNESDDLSNIGNKVIMDLDPANNVVVLAFGYYISKNKIEVLQRDYRAYQEKKTKKGITPKDTLAFLKDQHSYYFNITRKSLLYDTKKARECDNVFTDLIKEKIQIDKIINFKLIDAKRSVSNKESQKTLSSQSSRIYKKLERSSGNPEAVENFKDTLDKTDKELGEIYKKLFKEVLDDIKQLGGIKQDDSIIQIVSSLQERDLLEDNTTVVYGLSDNHSLPESYNGLGYMNLINMIFEIKIILHEFLKEEGEVPSDINLLFIEEPEAHTHPQMQYVFIKNIKSLLNRGILLDDGVTKATLQTILSTHSSHIVSESEFEDIKYFKKTDLGINSRNMKDLKKEYSDNTDYYKFLKQYLTLHRSELFFADKVIFIEGDTERILIPAMMKKIDQDDLQNEFKKGTDVSLPLLSQNISIIEVGAYFQIFEKFIDFIGIKTLIITDIDSVKKEVQIDKNGVVKKTKKGADKTTNKACPVDDGEKTSNDSLKYFYGDDKSLTDYTALSLNQRVLKKNSTTKCWVHDKDGYLLCVYQTLETNAVKDKYHARSFEDAFFHINREFIADSICDEKGDFIGNKTFPNLTRKRLKKYICSEETAWEMAKGVKKKPPFAMEILLNSVDRNITITNEEAKSKDVSVKYSNWNTPAYIKEGLQWLKKD